MSEDAYDGMAKYGLYKCEKCGEYTALGPKHACKPLWFVTCVADEHEENTWTEIRADSERDAASTYADREVADSARIAVRSEDGKVTHWYTELVSYYSASRID
jgi:hypothetical protein